MKILIVGSNSIHVSSYISSLGSFGYSMNLLAEEPCNFTNVDNEYIVSFRSINPFAILRSNSKIRSLLKELSPDVVHIHQANRLAYFVSRICVKMGIPCVLTAWGSDVLVIPKKNAFYKWLIKKTLVNSVFVTADSQEMIDAMNDLYPNPKKYIHLQYGIDLIDPKDKEQIIYSNRLHKDFYRIDKIIEYFAEFLNTHNNWKLVIGATGPETENLKELTKKLGISEDTTFVGWVNKDTNANWYSRASIYISIPMNDGTSVSLLEAMSAGCIPVVSDLKVSHEWIKNGENGIIEKSGVNPLTEAVAMNIDDCFIINRKLIEEKAERSNCTRRFIEIYNLALNDS